MPTMCVFNGNAFAAGFLMGLCHDFRVMHETIGVIQMSEMRVGYSLAPAVMKVLTAKLSPLVCSKVTYGVNIA